MLMIVTIIINNNNCNVIINNYNNSHILPHAGHQFRSWHQCNMLSKAMKNGAQAFWTHCKGLNW